MALEEIIRRLPNIFFDILTPRYKSELERTESFDNGCIHRIGFGSPMDKLFFPISGFISTIKFRPKLIHAYQASFGAGAAVIYKTFFPKTRLILTLQEGKELERQNFLIKYFRELIIKRADVITAISYYLSDFAKKINPKSELLTIPNGVDLEKFRHIPNSEENTIITVSRLVAKNGVGDIVRAVAIVKKEIADIKLIIVGSGPLEKDTRRSIKDLDMEGQVIMTGYQSPENVADYLSKAKVFVRPSLSEGLGTAFLEAMAAGLPIIGTPVGGIPDFLIDPSSTSGQAATGFFCEPQNPKSVAQTIEKVLTLSSQEKETIISRAQSIVKEKYDWDKIGKEMESMFECVYTNARIVL